MTCMSVKARVNFSNYIFWNWTLKIERNQKAWYKNIFRVPPAEHVSRYTTTQTKQIVVINLTHYFYYNLISDLHDVRVTKLFPPPLILNCNDLNPRDETVALMRKKKWDVSPHWSKNIERTFWHPPLWWTLTAFIYLRILRTQPSLLVPRPKFCPSRLEETRWVGLTRDTLPFQAGFFFLYEHFIVEK